MQVFLDSNVFLYAVGRDHPLKQPCAAVLRAVAIGSLEATTSTEVAQEVLYVLGRREDRALAVRVVRDLMSLFPSMLPVTIGELQGAAELFSDHPGLPARDAVHAATMLNAGIVNIVTADRDFELVSALKRIDPTDL